MYSKLLHYSKLCYFLGYFDATRIYVFSFLSFAFSRTLLVLLPSAHSIRFACQVLGHADNMLSFQGDL